VYRAEQLFCTTALIHVPTLLPLGDVFPARLCILAVDVATISVEAEKLL
jgi:hypothetical protein